MPRSCRRWRGARRPAPAPAPAAGRAAENALANLKMVLLLSALTLKAPVALYFYSKIFIFQSLLLLSPEDSGFYALVVSVVGLHALVCGSVLVLWPAAGLPARGQRKP